MPGLIFGLVIIMRRQLVPLGSLCRSTASLREFTMCCTRGGSSAYRGTATLSRAAQGSPAEVCRVRSRISSHIHGTRPTSSTSRRRPLPALLPPSLSPLPSSLSPLPYTACRALSSSTPPPPSYPLGLCPSRRLWLRRYGPMVLLNFGNVCALAGFLMTDVMWLRGFSLIATACGVTYNVLHDPPLRLPASWGVVFLCVNGCMLYSLLTEDEGVTFSDEAMDVFEEHFLPYGVTPRQFRKLLDIGTWHDAAPGCVLAEEGRPLSRLLLISSGAVEAWVGGQAIRSFSTFPGARHENGNKGIDAGAWIGEVNFLDGGGLKAAGAIATFVSQSQTRYLQWDNNSLRQLMTQDGRLSKSLVNAITGALVGKLLNFTTHNKNIHTQHYSEILSTVLVDEVVAPSEKKLIREYREQHNITDQAHKEALAQLGWTPEEFEDGMKHSPLMMEGAASAVRRINATLVHRNTMNTAEAIPPPQDPTTPTTDKPAETAAPAQ